MNTSKTLLTGLCALASLLLLGGCATLLQPELRPVVKSSLPGSTITVDIVGINDSELAIWRAKSVSAYFSANDPLRASAPKKTLTFDEGGGSSQTLSPTDPIWQRWAGRGATYIVVMADLPGFFEEDFARRQIIPLMSDRWNQSPESITIEIDRAGLTLIPAPSQPVN